MKTIATNLLTTALSLAFDRAGIVSGQALTIDQWLASDGLDPRYEPELRHLAEGVRDFAAYAGEADPLVPFPGHLSGCFGEYLVEAVVNAIFSLRLDGVDDDLDWTDLAHDLAIRLVGMARAYEIQTGESYPA
jgi:hypothetical protein